MADTERAAIRELARRTGRDRAKEDRAAAVERYEHRAQQPQGTSAPLDSPPEPDAGR